MFVFQTRNIGWCYLYKGKKGMWFDFDLYALMHIHFFWMELSLSSSATSDGRQQSQKKQQQKKKHASASEIPNYVATNREDKSNLASNASNY